MPGPVLLTAVGFMIKLRFQFALFSIVSCLSWKWRGRSTVKITERTDEEDTNALHGRREGRHFETAPVGADADYGLQPKADGFVGRRLKDLSVFVLLCYGLRPYAKTYDAMDSVKFQGPKVPDEH